MRIYLRELRKEKQMTCRELSELSGVARSHIQQIEKGESDPSLTVACRLCRALGVCLSDLVDCGNGPKQDKTGDLS